MAHALFQVANKAFIQKDGKILVLTTPKGYVDFPGGRLDETESHTAFKAALSREISEELGDAIQYEINDLLFASHRDYTFLEVKHTIVALYFSVTYLGGDFTLSDEHQRIEWLAPEELLARKDHFIGDEYEVIKEYLASHP